MKSMFLKEQRTSPFILSGRKAAVVEHRKYCVEFKSPRKGAPCASHIMCNAHYYPLGFLPALYVLRIYHVDTVN